MPPTSTIGKQLLSARAELHLNRLFQHGTDLYRGFERVLIQILEEEYDHFQSLLSADPTEVGSSETVIHSHKRRKVSEYVLFCRYMKKHHPEQERLQNVWKKLDKGDWRKRFKVTESSSVTVNSVIQSASVTQLCDEPVNPFLKSHRVKFKPVMEELLFQFDYESDYIDTLLNIRLSRTRIPAPVNISDSDYDDDDAETDSN